MTQDELARINNLLVPVKAFVDEMRLSMDESEYHDSGLIDADQAIDKISYLIRKHQLKEKVDG